MDLNPPMLIRSVNLEIDELVFTGLGPLDAASAAAVFERELARLVRAGGLPADVLREDRIAEVLSTLPPLPATRSARRLGRELAHSLYQGLVGELPGASAPSQRPAPPRPRPAGTTP